MILAGAGFEVHAVETGADALQAATTVELTLVTLDLGLPDMDGRDVARRLVAMTQAPILLITAFARPTDELGGMSAGASAYLTKPFRPAQLRTLVQQLCPQPSDATGRK